MTYANELLEIMPDHSFLSLPAVKASEVLDDQSSSLTGDDWCVSRLEFDVEELHEEFVCQSKHLLYCTEDGKPSSGPLWRPQASKEFEKCPPYLLIPANTEISVQFPTGQYAGMVFEFAPDSLDSTGFSLETNNVVFGLNASTYQLISLTLLELTLEYKGSTEVPEELVELLIVCAARMSNCPRVGAKLVDPSIAVASASKQIEQNIRDRNNALDGVYKVSGMSERHLQRKFRDETGMSLQEFLTQFRIKLAKVYLSADQLALKTIAYDLGYANPSHFTRSFKEVTGVTPSVYRKDLLRQENK